jgi:DNA-binding XRE family transcriptional regulator
LRKRPEYPFEVEESVKQLGERLRLARIRRSVSQEEMAQKSGITRKTLSEIEKGHAGASFGNVLAVLWTLGMLDGVKHLADPETDEHGRILEAARQRQRVRHSPASEPDNDF